MPSELPIACSLSDSELPRRLAEMADVGSANLVAVQTEDGRAELRFAVEVRERLAALVAAETECCAFLQLELDEQPDALLLTIDAPAGGEPILEELIAAFRGEREV